jgi:hypothetical protein
MNRKEKEIIEIAKEINKLLSDGEEIHPNDPIANSLNFALERLETIKPKNVKNKKKPNGFIKYKDWCEVIKKL